ncbi:acyl-CoA desaturase [Ramlibacter tataouinensis]|uniref:Fatty acid desaturase, membrane protein-like protein n=1 Tax=Ramlibacter tataouinensis (strain ATCC BAA-407 / DSM 14655 / LMG 21543 / TTB310) TaxID=365046 RepID=F5XVI1_RAMTT|nr:acyl-CoA desaturase [Ramlibacter tataouinensis]AEG91557.1 fatty acid desaturase, membrane protein-like protein [Ramlibacter tataouinensis TTB310]
MSTYSETAPAAAVQQEDATPPRSRAVVYDRRLVGTKNFYAGLTVTVPTLFTAYAVFLAFREGVSGLDIAMCLVMYLLTLMGITVGFHRLLAHRSFVADRWVKIVFAVFGTWAAQAPVIHWVANHRRHHATSDQPGDPHSPHLSGSTLSGRIKGLWHAHIGSMFAPEVTNYATFGPDLLRDPDIRWLNNNYLWVVLSGLALPAAIGGLVTQSWWGAWTALVWGGFVRMFVVHHAIWAITSIAHTVGRRVYESGDHARNFALLALVTGGEGWHSTHHAFPRTAIFSTAPWQIDIGGIFIWALEKMGAAREVNRLTPEQMRAKALYR